MEVESAYAHHVKVDSVGAAAMTLSGKVVRIEGGSAEAAPLEDGGRLASGSNFDVLRALENMDLVHNIEQVEAILRDLNELGRQVQLGDGRIPEAIDGVMSLIEDLQAGRGTLGRLLKDEKTLVDIEALIVSVDEMAASVESAAVQLEKTSGAVDQASGSIVDGAGHIATASEALGRTALSVDASASKLANSLDRLDAGLVELEKTMRAIQGLPLVRKQVEKNEEE